MFSTIAARVVFRPVRATPTAIVAARIARSVASRTKRRRMINYTRSLDRTTTGLPNFRYKRRRRIRRSSGSAAYCWAPPAQDQFQCRERPDASVVHAPCSYSGVCLLCYIYPFVSAIFIARRRSRSA
jgi:hypothetical protein